MINLINSLFSTKEINKHATPLMPAPMPPKMVELAVGQNISEPDEKRPTILLRPRAMVKNLALSANSGVSFTRS